MSDSDVPPLYEIRAFLDPNFNARLLQAVACGLYTAIFVQAIRTLSKKSRNNVYLYALVFLWIATMINFSFNWAAVRCSFTLNSSSPFDMVLGVLPKSLSIMNNVSGVLNSSISNGIMIWRCHTLWAKRSILVPLLILAIANAGFILYGDFAPPTRNSLIIGSLGIMISFTTAISTTSLIALKIILVTKGSHMRRTYSRVLRIIVESAAMISVVDLILGVTTMISVRVPLRLSTPSGRSLNELFVYFSCLIQPVSGIAPTLIAFRVAEESSDTDADGSGSSYFSTSTLRNGINKGGNTGSESTYFSPH